MKYLLTASLVLLAWTVCLGQELVVVKDTVNHFEIGVPVGWRYGVPTNTAVEFIALREKQNDQDVPRENFNINIFHRDEVDLDKTYKIFKKSIRDAEGFAILEEGEKIVNNRKYKYLLETHKNSVSKEPMHNYVLFTNNNGEILILTMATTSANISKFKTLFDAIGQSLNY